MACSSEPSSNVSPYLRTLDCVHCGLCLPTCPTYQVLQVEADSPRGRVYLMRAFAEGRVQDPAAIRPFLDRCLGCRACETACPSGVHYGEVLEHTRAAIEQATPKRGLAARLTRFLLRHVVAHQGRLRLLFTAMRAAELLGLRWLATKLRLLPAHVAALAPKVPPGRERRPLPTGLHRPPPGVTPRGVRVALFTGCIMEPMFGRVNRATLELLLRNGFEVEVPAAQVCCGALLVHAGLTGPARDLARRNVQAFAAADLVVNNSAGCGAQLKEYGLLLGDEPGRAFAAKCRDICEFLATVGLTATPAPLVARAAYDDPCHLCHGQGVRSEPRALLAQVPGLELVSHQGPEDCCGSAGIYNLLQPAVAGAIGERKVAALLRAAPDLVVTGNPGCMMQIDSHLRRCGHSVPVRHPVELLLPPR
ncbi:MAG: 4Fe-4S dicluster domain-containing protein [Planctomycetes bacterium]|nr:4Fe-4S dicluster domain-containing protein [Planctomycetota bacterium]